MAQPQMPALRPVRFRMARTVFALILREMSTTYGRSPGGYLWRIVEPVGGIAMLTLILAVGLRIRTPSLGINFPLFFATAVLTIAMFQRTSGTVANALNSSRQLLFYPGVTFAHAIIARAVLELITGIVVMYLIFGGLLLLFDTRTILDLQPILATIAMAWLLGLGVGCLNAYLFPTFPLWATAWGILTFPLAMMSGLFYIYEDLPAVGQQVLWYNPLIHLTGLMRAGFYPTYQPTYIEPAYVVGFALVPMVLGLMLLRRHSRTILNI